jgi:hypothetical protein
MKTARWRALEALSARVDFLLGVHATSGGGEVGTSLLFFPFSRVRVRGSTVSVWIEIRHILFFSVIVLSRSDSKQIDIFDPFLSRFEIGSSLS